MIDSEVKIKIDAQDSWSGLSDALRHDTPALGGWRMADGHTQTGPVKPMGKLPGGRVSSNGRAAPLVRNLRQARPTSFRPAEIAP